MRRMLNKRKAIPAQRFFVISVLLIVMCIMITSCRQLSELPSTPDTTINSPTAVPSGADTSEELSVFSTGEEHLDWDSLKNRIEVITGEYYELQKLRAAQFGQGDFTNAYSHIELHRRFLDTVASILTQPFSIKSEHPCLSYENELFYMHSVNEARDSDMNYRLLEAGPFSPDEGAGSALFLQWWDADMKSNAAKVDQLFRTCVEGGNYKQTELTIVGNELRILILNEWDRFERGTVPEIRTILINKDRLNSFYLQSLDTIGKMESGIYAWGSIECDERPYNHAVVHNSEIYYIEEVEAGNLPFMPLTPKDETLMPVGILLAYNPFTDMIRQLPDAWVAACNFTIMDNSIYYTDYILRRFVTMSLSGEIIKKYDVAMPEFKLDEHAVYYVDSYEQNRVMRMSLADEIITSLSWPMNKGYVSYVSQDAIYVYSEYVTTYKDRAEQFSGYFFINKDGSGFTADMIFYQNKNINFGCILGDVRLEDVLPIMPAARVSAPPKVNIYSLSEVNDPGGYRINFEILETISVDEDSVASVIERILLEKIFRSEIEKNQFGPISPLNGVCYKDGVLTIDYSTVGSKYLSRGSTASYFIKQEVLRTVFSCSLINVLDERLNGESETDVNHYSFYRVERTRQYNAYIDESMMARVK